ncbi:MAG: hypothetical protein RR275_09100 [Lachnospiraceae bacterium]
MPGVHKNPTISFRISDYERQEIEAKIKASGMMKKDYFIRSCIYNHVCVVGKKETVYVLVKELQKMQQNLYQLHEQILSENIPMTSSEIQELQLDYEYMLKAILWMLEGARYLWDGKNTAGKDGDNCGGGESRT